MIFTLALASTLLLGVPATAHPWRQADGEAVDDEVLPPGYKLPKGAPKPLDASLDGKEPRTCDDQCEAMKRSMRESCKSAKSSKKSPGGAKACEDTGAQVVQLCQESCRAKGRIDPEYMKAHAQKPKPPPGAHTGPKPGGAGEVGTDATPNPE